MQESKNPSSCKPRATIFGTFLLLGQLVPKIAVSDMVEIRLRGYEWQPLN
jgi:hypothetical protein